MSEKLIKTEQQLIKNIKSFHSVQFKLENGETLSENEQKSMSAYKQTIKLGRRFIVSKINNEYYFSPSRFVGYYRNGKVNTLRQHFSVNKNGHISANGSVDGRESNKIIELIVGKTVPEDGQSYRSIFKKYENFCKKLGISPSKNSKNFWILDEEILFDSLGQRLRSINSASSSKKQEEDDFSNVTKTEREIIVKARVGQGAFRDSLIKKFGKSCSVSGAEQLEVLRASHIKPWSKSNPEERLDVNNGLLLRADLDALFDKGLITFSDEGKIKISKSLQCSQTRAFLQSLKLQEVLNSEQKKYLKYHQNKVFKE